MYRSQTTLTHPGNFNSWDPYCSNSPGPIADHVNPDLYECFAKEKSCEKCDLLYSFP